METKGVDQQCISVVIIKGLLTFDLLSYCIPIAKYLTIIVFELFTNISSSQTTNTITQNLNLIAIKCNYLCT